jgi:dTDP-4-amino-4,6-dideoxygalactose transaminase
MADSSRSKAEPVGKASSQSARAPIALIDLKAQQRLIRERLDRAITRVLDHGQYIMGPEVGQLERELAAFTGAKHAISCSSGTDALLIAMMTKGVGPGHAVLCPGFTYTATPETIALLGATPVFVDVDPATFNIDPAGMKSGLDAAAKLDLKPVGVIAVDLFGLTADYAAVNEFAKEHGLWVLADAAQSFGATSGSQRVGTFGDITATSFFPAKPLGCYGDGGAMFTDDDEIARKMDSIRLHGKGSGDDKYDIVRVGINGRLDTIQAAVLCEKLAIFPGEVERRQKVADRYKQGLEDCVTTPSVPQGCVSVWAQYTVRLPAHRRAGVIKSLAEAGVPSAVYYPRPLHHQSAYRDYPIALSGLANSEQLSGEVLSLPMHPYLGVEDQDYIIAAFRRAMAT